MKNYYFFFLLSFLIFIGCSKDENLETNHNDSGKIENIKDVPAYAIKGVLTLKVQSEVQPLISVIMTRSGTTRTGLREIDRLCEQFNVVSFKPVFNVEGDKFEKRKKQMGMHLWYEVHFSEENELKEVIHEFSKLKSVEKTNYTIPIVGIGDEKVRIATEADLVQTRNISTYSSLPYNDPQLIAQWNLNNTGDLFNNTKPGADINAFKAWELTTGSGDVIVAVMDSGIDVNHEDLKANLWVNPNKSGDNPFKDAVHGWNFSGVGEGKDLSEPENYHGTHVSGTVAAVTNNGIGIAGVAGGNGTPNSGAKIMTLQIARQGQWGSDVNIANSFIFAADNGAVIAQNSWGAIGGETSELIKLGIDYFIDYAGVDVDGNQSGPIRGGLVVFASGNHGHEAPEAPVTPGSYERVMSVANMGPDYQMNYTTAFGKWLSITAPGGALAGLNPDNGITYITENEVLSTVLDGEYGYAAGTSMAAPHVSGIAALVVDKLGGKNSGLRGEQVKAILLNSTRNIDQYLSEKYIGKIGTGLVDAYAALTMDVESMHSIPESVTDLKADFSERDKIKLEWSITADSKYELAPIYEVMVSQQDLTNVDFDRVPTHAVKGVYTVKEGQTVGSKMTGTIGGLRGNTTYYIAISAMGKFYDRSKTHMVVHGTTSKGTAPEPVNDLVVAWNEIDGKLEGELSWTVTKDVDTETPEWYEILLSKRELDGVDFDNPPAEVEKIEVPVTEGMGLGSRMSYTLTDLDIWEVYYIAITGVDIDRQRSTAAMAKYDGSNKPKEPGREKGIVLYPNPVTTILNIATDSKETKKHNISFYNAEGVRALQHSLLLNDKVAGKINVSKLSAGVYTVVIEHDGKKTNKRIIKQ